MTKIGRNQPCPCGSGKKYKKCCYGKNNVDKTLLSNGLGKNLPKGTIVTARPKKEEKMSEILIKFAEPWINVCETDRAIHSALQLSAIAWNLSFFPFTKRDKLIDDDINKYIKDNYDKEIAKEIISSMLERKEKNFSHIRMMIMDFQISNKDGQHHLTVMSAPIIE